MAENNNVQQVKIVTNEINLRATSLRARLTDVVTMKKCGNADEFRKAMIQFDRAIDQFKKAII